jgi:hypothetical protein
MPFIEAAASSLHVISTTCAWFEGRSRDERAMATGCCGPRRAGPGWAAHDGPLTTGPW